MGYNMKRGNSAVPFKELGSSPAKEKAQVESSKAAADGHDYSDKRYDYKSTDFLKTDYASGHGVGDLTTVKRLNKQNQKAGKDYKDHGGSKSGDSKKIALSGVTGKTGKQLVKSKKTVDAIAKGGSKALKTTITDKTKMKAPYKKPVGPRVN